MRANNNKSFVSKPNIIYFFSIIAICLILIMTVGDKIHGTAYDFSPSDSVAERFRYVWLEFTANLGAVFNLSGLASTVTEYTQSDYSYRYMGMFWLLYYEYFFATRLVGMVVKEKTVIDRLLGIVSGCVLQVVLAIILFTYPTEAWKAIVFYLIVFVGMSLLVSIIVVLFMWVGCFFSTPWLLQNSWEYASNDDGSVSCRRFVWRILSCYGMPLKFPFITRILFRHYCIYAFRGSVYTVDIPTGIDLAEQDIPNCHKCFNIVLAEQAWSIRSFKAAHRQRKRNENDIGRYLLPDFWLDSASRLVFQYGAGA